MEEVNEAPAKQGASQNASFRQLAFIAGIVLLLGAWKFGIEGLME